VTLSLLALVLVSALAHAWWNFLLKRSAGFDIFVGLSKVVEALAFAPFFVVLALPGMPLTWHAVGLVLVATAGVLANYAALTMAYRHGDLMIAYPVSRGATLLFLPVLGWLALGERLAPLGLLGLATIVAGVVVLNLPAISLAALRQLEEHLRHRAIFWAVVVALNTAVFTLWDKFAVQSLEPFTYMYLYTALTAVGYMVFVARRHPRAVIAREWRDKRGAIVQVGLLNTLSYLLILFALRTGVSSYVIGFRQLSIAFGVLLGWRLLGESFSPARRAGVVLIVAGCVLVAWTR
jgi:drug/metabolite transporter (DMT)-like permease